MMETTRQHLILDNPDILDKFNLANECLELERIVRKFYYLSFYALDGLDDFYREAESFENRHPRRSKRKNAETFYLESERPLIYKKDDSEHYSNKGSHIERTLGNEMHRSAGHKEHWKKEKRKTHLKTLGKIKS